MKQGSLQRFKQMFRIAIRDEMIIVWSSISSYTDLEAQMRLVLHHVPKTRVTVGHLKGEKQLY